MSTLFVGGSRVTLDPSKAIGKGGEADVYEYKGQALKVYKGPDHIDYKNNPHEKKGAKERLIVHQRKLPAFPKGLPNGAVAPIDLALSDKQEVRGYTMQFLQGAEVLFMYGTPAFCQTGVTGEQRLEIMRKLYRLVSGCHQKDLVLGDFNDLNVMVIGSDPYLVDLDSAQFTANGETFYCTTFQQQFVDPKICDPREDLTICNKCSQLTAPYPANGRCPSCQSDDLRRAGLLMCQPHSKATDWYAYWVMLMKLLLFIDPYGGVYPQKLCRPDARPFRRITVLDPKVKCPKFAVPLSVLPDDLLEVFHQTFVQDRRWEPEPSLLSRLRWTTCVNCGAEHMRAKCPQCAAAAPGVVTQVTQVRGQVTATRLFKTDGVIVYATVEHGKLKWIYHDRGEIRREDDLFSAKLDLKPGMRFRLQGKNTIVGHQGKMVVLTPGLLPKIIAVDSYGQLPMFDANETNIYFTDGGLLRATADLGDPFTGTRWIGDILRNQTLFWAGHEMGFGFYRAGSLCVSFTFDAKQGGIKDTIQVDIPRGQLLDSTCFFHKDRAWFVVSHQDGGKTVNQCTCLRLDGRIEGTATADAGDGSWLGQIRGKCAVGNFLLAATDDGIVRVEAIGGQLSVVKEFPDTEPWVTSQTHLFPGPQGVYAVSGKEIHLLKIA
jgi:tRNA A-37 threonylcarbamoyl transferase component Bud32